MGTIFVCEICKFKFALSYMIASITLLCGCLAIVDVWFVVVVGRFSVDTSTTSSGTLNNKQRPTDSILQQTIPSLLLPNPYWQNNRTMNEDDLHSLILLSTQEGQAENPKHKHLVAYFFQNNRFLYHIFNKCSFPDTTRRGKMEWLYMEAIQYLQSSAVAATTDNKATTSDWPRLHAELKNGSFAFLVDYGDVAHDNQSIFKFRTTRDGTKRLREVAAFSNAMSSDTHAQVRMALPTYFSIQLARFKAHSLLSDNNSTKRNRTAWIKKHSRAVWRGSNNNGQQRWHLNQLAFETRSPLLDVRFTDVSESQLVKRNFSQVDTVVNHMPMEQFADYKAILDVDGNSWSGRFGSLLCMDSVVVKIEPTMVDHFWSQVQPWQHYVPVNGNLSNLMEQVEWIMEHAKESQEIIANANGWCRSKFQTTVLIRDLLDIWESYATHIWKPSVYKEHNNNSAWDFIHPKLSQLGR